MTSIKARILMILGVLALGYLMLLGMVQFTAETARARIDRVSSALFPATLKMQEAEASFEQMTKQYNEAAILEDKTALEAAQRDGETVDSALQAVRRETGEVPELEQTADHLLVQLSEIRAQSHSTYGALLSRPDNVTVALQAQVAALAKDDKDFFGAMQALDGLLAEQARAEFSAINAESLRSRIAGWAMVLIALAGCTGAWRVLQRKVFEPLENLALRMRDIADGDGDLTGRVEVLGRNELDEVGRWFNVFIERVEHIVHRVTENAQALADAATALARIAGETATQTAMQQAQALSITGSMSQISTAAFEISETTQKAAADARKAEQNAQVGGQTIQSAVAKIQQVHAANKATATKIEELGRASREIGKITHVIDEIANQAGLLALNASIEAARAGEHGRGFAVVAGEVRRLAERTSAATSEIDKTVRAIQGETAEVVVAMRASMMSVESGVESARSAGETLSRIIEGSEALQRMVTQIATASTEQSSAAHSVNANLTEIASIGEKTTGSSARAVDACDRLSHLAADLNELVGSFKARSAWGGPISLGTVGVS